MSFTDRMLAGAGSRGMTQTVLQPIDVMRTRMQAKNIATALTAGSFVKGIIPQFTLAVPAGALQFSGYEWAKDQFAKAGATGGALVEMASAATGALCASFIRVPQEVMKQRCMAGIYPNVFAGFKTLMETEGPGGLYKGYFATISRDIPFNMLSFMFFAQAKKAFAAMKGRASDVQENLVMGALCGMTAAVIMTPVDVIKTRLMTSDASGIIGTFNSIVKEEGAATLMKGVTPRIMYLAPFASMTLSFYELFGKTLVSRKTGVPVSELA